MRSRLAVLALAASLVLTGCQLLGDQEGPEPALDALAEGLASGDLGAVPFDVEDPSAAYAEVITGLGEVIPGVDVADAEVTDDTATASVSWTWELDGQPWTYDTTADLTRVDDAWQVTWAPSLVEPSLVEGEHLTLTRTPAERGRITGAGDRAIVAPRDVVRLGLDKTKLTAEQVAAGQVTASAQAIAAALEVDAARLRRAGRGRGRQGVRRGAGAPRGGRDHRRTPGYADIPGAVAIADQQHLAPSRGFAAPILGSVGDATAEIIEESNGSVEAGDVVGLSGLQARYDDGADRHARADRHRGRCRQTTGPSTRWPRCRGAAAADHAGHRPADQGRAGPGRRSARRARIVAIRPSDGAILAAASGPGSKGLNTATYGQYAPGSTFKVVTSLALLRSGLQPERHGAVPGDDRGGRQVLQELRRLPCLRHRHDHAAAGGRQLVQHRLHLLERDRLRDGDLADAAAALGLGVDHDLGFPAYFGQVPPPAGETEAAADLIGQGKVLASPMAMATVAASVAAGRAVLPVLLPDLDVEQAAPVRAADRSGGGGAQGADAGRGDRRARARSSPTCPGGGRQDGHGGVRLTRRLRARCPRTRG